MRGITHGRMAGLSRQPEKDQPELALHENAPTEAGSAISGANHPMI